VLAARPGYCPKVPRSASTPAKVFLPPSTKAWIHRSRLAAGTPRG